MIGTKFRQNSVNFRKVEARDEVVAVCTVDVI